MNVVLLTVIVVPKTCVARDKPWLIASQSEFRFIVNYSVLFNVTLVEINVPLKYLCNSFSNFHKNSNFCRIKPLCCCSCILWLPIDPTVQVDCNSSFSVNIFLECWYLAYVHWNPVVVLLSVYKCEPVVCACSHHAAFPRLFHAE